MMDEFLKPTLFSGVSQNPIWRGSFSFQLFWVYMMIQRQKKQPVEYGPTDNSVLRQMIRA